MKIARFLPFFAFLSLSVLNFDARAIKLPPPPTIAQLAGVWIGPDESGAVLRLELDGRGTGRLQVSERGSPAVLSSYNVTIKKDRYASKLSFAVSPAENSPGNFSLSGSAVVGAHAISLVRHFNDAYEGAHLNALLIRESDLALGSQRLKDMAAQSNAHRGR
ncbi:hypothetical protein [Frateuria terrea]|uniref:hypothetical protein n=1 Tax=Frateuria terrea TaxID=529704 RepID=UPI001113EF37|nr:hypothetical protein [Frateuria terrea]